MEPEPTRRPLEHGIPAQVLIYPQPVAPAVAAGGLLLADLFAAIRARLLMVFGGAVGGALLAVLLSLHLKPVYEATAVYAPAMATGRAAFNSISGGSLASLGQIAGISLQGPALGAIAVLVESRDTAITALRKEDLLPLLFPSRWDRKKQAWRPPHVTWWRKLTGNVPQSATGEPTPAEIARRIAAIRTVDEKSLSNTLTVKVRLGDPEAAARLANRLAFYVNEAERERARDEANKAVAYLRDQLDRSPQVALQESLARLLQSQMETAALADSREDFVVRVVDPAVVPDMKVSPRRSLFALFGFIGGGLLATILAVRRHEPVRLRTALAG